MEAEGELGLRESVGERYERMTKLLDDPDGFVVSRAADGRFIDVLLPMDRNTVLTPRVCGRTLLARC